MDPQWVGDLANLAGVTLIAVLLVWRIDARMGAVETSVRDLCVRIGELLGKLEE